MYKVVILCIYLFGVLPQCLQAQGLNNPEDRYLALEKRMDALESEVAALKTALEAAETAAAPAAPAPVLGGAGSMAKALNPDVSVVGNFIGGAGHNRIDPSPSLSLRESEVGLQAIVDPYARADFFISVGSDGAGVEEGYLTFPALPGGFLAKVGRMRTNFGKLNPLHSHVLPWVDRPLFVYNLLGGEPGEADAGIKDEGLAISRILPAPGEIFLEGSAEIYQGNSGGLFQAQSRNELSSFYRLRGYKDLTEATNIEIGGSYARGHNDSGPGMLTHLADLDATLRWKPLRRAIYHSFIGRGEFVWSHRQQPSGTQRAFGFYASGDYQLGRRWFTGARLDWSERAADARFHDSAQSIVLTYWPSEFSQVRGQLRRTRYAEGTTANEFLFQFQFSIGAHGAHPF